MRRISGLYEKLFSHIYKEFKKIPDARGPNKSIPLEDALMSMLGIFALKFPSLLKLEEVRANDESAGNFTSLFGIKKIPSDTQTRKILDDISPEYLYPLFKSLFQYLQRNKSLTDFEFTRKNKQPYYLVAIDGTQYFSSKEIHCNSCMVKRHRNGTETYYHQIVSAVIVHPSKKEVIPLAVEGIMKSDGSEKNDCEYSATKRLIKRLRKDHPQLNIIICGDALYARGDLVQYLRAHKMSYILNVKPKGHKKLFNFVEDREYRAEDNRLKENEQPVIYCERNEQIGDKVKKKVSQRFRYTNDIKLDNSDFSSKFTCNFLEYKETIRWQGKRGLEVVKKNFSWATDITLTNPDFSKVKQHSMNVVEVMRGGRSRWHIENNTFRTLTIEGYHFKHNFGHGEKNLSFVIVLLMMLQFLIDQMVQLKDIVFQKALAVYKYKSHLYDLIRAAYEFIQLESWQHLLELLIKRRSPDTS